MRSMDHPDLWNNYMLTVAEAARIAHRSVRTIRRAYLSGKLIAHRDGNGRTVRIRSADLRAWLTAEPIAPPQEPPATQSVGRIEAWRRPDDRTRSANLALLTPPARGRSPPLPTLLGGPMGHGEILAERER